MPRRLQYQHRTFEQCQFLPPEDNYLCTCRAPVHDGALSYDPPTPLPGGSIADFTTTKDAQWSGTSFAAPIVAGFIAHRMAQDEHITARQVYDEMVKNGPTIDVAGHPALKVVPDNYDPKPLFPLF
jgi:subtilisin family serine protease